MIREQYLGRLWEQLSVIPEPQRRELMMDYEEHFRLAAEHGKSEEEAARELGDPRMIAKELLLGYRVVEAERSGGVVRISRAVLATVSLGFFNLVFVLGPYIALLGVLIALWATAFALCVTPAAIMYEGLMGEALTLAQAAFLSIAALGFGILLCAGAHKLTRGVFKMTLKYLRFNSRVMGGRKK